MDGGRVVRATVQPCKICLVLIEIITLGRKDCLVAHVFSFVRRFLSSPDTVQCPEIEVDRELFRVKGRKRDKSRREIAFVLLTWVHESPS